MIVAMNFGTHSNTEHNIPQKLKNRNNTIGFILALLVCLISSLLLCGCSSPVSSEVIKADIAEHTGFSDILYEGLDISEVNIIKRNTDKQNNIDEIWVSVKGENEILHAIRNYKLTYKLYNDGWLFETYESYRDHEHWDETSAQSCVSQEDAQALLETWDLQSYASFSTVLDIDIIVIDIVEFSAENGKCEFIAGVCFTYPLLVEYVEVPLSFEFTPTEGHDADWAWNGSIGHISNRTLDLGMDIRGAWSCAGGLLGYLNITGLESSTGSSPSSLQENDIGLIWWPIGSKCKVEDFSIPGEYSSQKSWTSLQWDTHQSTGKLTSPRLVWIDLHGTGSPIYIYPDGVDGYSEPLIQILSRASYGYYTKND